MSSFSTATISASNHSPKYSDQTQSPTLNRDNSWGGGGKEEDMLQNHLLIVPTGAPVQDKHEKFRKDIIVFPSISS